MRGAIADDVVGAVNAARPVKKSDFGLFPSVANFTVDSVLTVAVT
jgi:hypothetical protein